MSNQALEIVARINCVGRDCPTIYRKDENTVIIQGYKADELFAEGLPDGEQAVEVPLELLRDLGV